MENEHFGVSLRRIAMLSGPLFLRLRAAFSWKETPSCQCRLFSKARWYGRKQDLRRRYPGQGEVPRLQSCTVGCLAGGLDPAKCLQAGEIIILSQRLARYYRCLSGFRPAVAGILGKHARVRVWLCPEAGPSIRQKRGLIGLERKAPVATTRIDRCNCAAIAVQRIVGHYLPFEGEQAERLHRGLLFRTPIDRYVGQRQAQPGSIGRDHDPCPGALSCIAVPTQGFAVNGGHVALTKEGCDIGQYAPEGRIELLGIDHPEHGREGAMRRHRVPEFEEVHENTILCASEGCHISAERCVVKHRYEREDLQLIQIMSGVLGAVSGDYLKGGQEQMHG